MERKPKTPEEVEKMKREEQAWQETLRMTESERKDAQEQARVACHPLEEAMHECFDTKWFGFVRCQDEIEAFWACYKEKRGFLRTRMQLWRDEQANKVSGARTSLDDGSSDNSIKEKTPPN